MKMSPLILIALAAVSALGNDAVVPEHEFVEGPLSFGAEDEVGALHGGEAAASTEGTELTQTKYELTQTKYELWINCPKASNCDPAQRAQFYDGTHTCQTCTDCDAYDSATVICPEATKCNTYGPGAHVNCPKARVVRY